MTQKTRKSHNNAILNIRLPEPILAQLTTISDAQYKSVSTVVRDLIVQYIQQNAIFLNAPQAQSTRLGRPMTAREMKDAQEQNMRQPSSFIPQSPSQQYISEITSEWD